MNLKNAVNVIMKKEEEYIAKAVVRDIMFLKELTLLQ